MNIDLVSRIEQLWKLFLRYIWTIFIASGVLLFSPNWFLVKLSLATFVKDYGIWVSVAFLISLVSIVIRTVSWFGNSVVRCWNQGKYRKRQIERLSRLSDDEQSVLREFFIQKKNTLKLPLGNPSVAGLLRDKILVVVSECCQQTSAGLLGSVAIDRTIQNGIKHSCINLPEEPWTDGDNERLTKNRPPFVANVEYINELYGE